MKYIAIALLVLLSACSGNWGNPAYGPGDWLAENTGLKVSSLYTYERLKTPLITVHVVTDPLEKYCGSRHADGCETHNADWTESTIYIRERAPAWTEAHERKHAHGYCHYMPDTSKHWGMTAAQVANEYRLSQMWYPCEE